MGKARVMAQHYEHLNAELRSAPVRRFSTHLRERIVGQEGAIEAILDSFSRILAGIRDRERPILTLLFLGPTGVGKTETVKALSETLFGRRDAFVRINCQEFATEGAIAKIFGSPPGYVGADIQPMLSQERLDSHHKNAQEERRGVFADGEGRIAKLFPRDAAHYLSIVCFDEIEKAHPSLWNGLLGMMDDGHVTLGNNTVVDCTRTIVIMTTNVGAEEMSRTLADRTVGFDLGQDLDVLNGEVSKQAIAAAQEVFPYEFYNRFDDVICFRALTREDCHRILDRMLQALYRRLMDANVPIILHCSSAFKAFLLAEGFNPQFGARQLRRAVERHLISPLARLIATEQVRPGQVIGVGMQKGAPDFRLEIVDEGGGKLLV